MAASAIRGYQRWVSPYKGYVCAHRQLHGGWSCSEFARRQILENGVWRALPGIANQFRECGEAAQYLRRRRREAMLAAAGASEHAGVLAMARGGSAKRSLEERIYEEGEEKRKRLNELQGDNPWWVGPEWRDGCGA
ncbi:MAG: membrane protein insertion efficiency factor YidD, partial [Planctomycetaceae bacterium]|nr:membrane protein insertion efficiency factor YidD [Planctomycetaceae bacterium]